MNKIKNKNGQFSLGTLKLTVSQKGIWFFACWYQFMEIKKWLKILRWAWSKWVWPVWWEGSKTDSIWRMNRWNNWFFACWYIFIKTKSWAKMFWVGMVKRWVWPVWSWDFKIDCISEMNRWNKLIFCTLVQI